jgi:UDP-2-acetamido-3-amino-2,3-dideoxy-glucuronate N-acetyltransferase
MTAVPRVACIGAGYWGKNLVRNFAELGALAAVCDANEEVARRLSSDNRVRCATAADDVLEASDVTGVAIATPAETHADLVRRALLAGKDVLVEKPLALSPQEGAELVALADRRRRILMVGHLLWYHPAILKLRELVRGGELGRIQYIYSNRLNLGRIRREENILWSFAPHDISIILGLLGEYPDTVQAQGGNYLHERIADVTVTLLGFPSGVRAHIFVSWLHPFKEQKLVIVGDRKMAVFDDTEPKDKLRLYPHTIAWLDNVPVPKAAAAEVVDVEAIEPLRAECEHFLDCIRTRTRPRTDGEEGLRVLRVLQQCQAALGARPTNGRGSPAGEYFVHESAVIDEDVTIGSGTKIWHFSHVLPKSRIGRDCRIGQNVVIGPNVTIGDGVKIQNNVSVYEGVTLEDHVFCGPSMVFTNVYNPRSEIRRMSELRPTLVRRGATLGANCTIVCGVTIGLYAFVAAGAVVTRDVPDYALIVGNPGRVAGWMCACGNRIRFEPTGDKGSCTACGKRYRKVQSKVWEE